MIDEKYLAKLTLERWEREIQRAVRRVKQPRPTEFGKWFRREWHRGAAVSRWPEWRRRLYWERRRVRNRLSAEERPEVMKMSLCRECWKPFRSDDRNAWICGKCRDQEKLTQYMAEEDEKAAREWAMR